MARVGRDTNTARKGDLQGGYSSSVDWVSTLLKKGAAPLLSQHLQYRRQPVGSITLHCVLLDLSNSMLRGKKLEWAKGCLLTMAEQFYRRRDHLAVIGFSGNQACVIQPAGRIATFNENWIAPLQGGGGTPIASAMDTLELIIGQQRKRHRCASAHVWLMTDGRFDPIPAKPELADVCHVIDFENDTIALQRCSCVAEAWQATWIRAEDFFAAVAE